MRSSTIVVNQTYTTPTATATRFQVPHSLPHHMHACLVSPSIAILHRSRKRVATTPGDLARCLSSSHAPTTCVPTAHPTIPSPRVCAHMHILCSCLLLRTSSLIALHANLSYVVAVGRFCYIAQHTWDAALPQSSTVRTGLIFTTH